MRGIRRWLLAGLGIPALVLGVSVMPIPAAAAAPTAPSAAIAAAAPTDTLATASSPDASRASASAAAQLPAGSLDDWTVGVGSVRLWGWALDLDAPTAPVAVHVYDQQPDGAVVGRAFVADTSRPDVGAAFPGTGSLHGFDVSVQPQGTGRHSLCVYAIDPQGSGATALGCRTFDVPAPIGALDFAVNSETGLLSIRGWAAEFDVPDGQPYVNVYVKGPSGVSRGYDQTQLQTWSRRDVSAVVPWVGTNIGYAGSLPLFETGPTEVCSYAISRSTPRAVTLLGCFTTTVLSPFGALDAVSWDGGGLRVQGWAINPNLPLLQALVYATDVTPDGNGSGVTVLTDGDRPDVKAVFPDIGATPGYDVRVPTTVPGPHQVCVYVTAMSGGLEDTLLGCRDVVAP